MSEVVERAIYELTVRGEERLVGVVSTLNNVATATDKVTRATRTAEDGVERIITRLDKRAGAEAQLVKSLEHLKRLEEEGIGTKTRLAVATDLVIQRYNTQVAALAKTGTALNDNNAGMLGATQRSRAMQFALQNLGFQINDVATSLVSGINPMQTFAQQAGQFVQLFSQGGGVKSVLGELGATIRGWITPATLATAGIVGLGAAFGGLLLRSANNAEQLRQFNLSLRNTGKDASTTAEELVKVVKRLQEVGVARSDAEAALQALIRNPRINAARAGEIESIGKGIAANLGLDPLQGIDKFVKGLEGGVAGVMKLATEMGALDDKQVTYILRLERSGEAQRAFALTIDAIKAKMGDYKETLSDSANAVNSISTAWRNMIDALANTKTVEGARLAIAALFQGVANTITVPVTPLTGTAKEVSGPAANWSISMLQPVIPILNWYRNIGQGAFNALPDSGAAQQRFLEHSGIRPLGIGGALGGGASSVFTQTANASLNSVDPELVRVFERTLIETGMRGIITSTTGGGHAAGSMHFPENNSSGLGQALDFNLLDASGKPMLHAAAKRVGSPEYDAYVKFGEAFKKLAGEAGISGTDFGKFDPGHVGLKSDLVLPNSAELGKARADTEALVEAEKRRTDATRLRGPLQQAQIAREETYNATIRELSGVLDDNAVKAEARKRAEEAAANVLARANIENAKAFEIQDMRNNSMLRSLEGFKESEAAGYRALALAQAEIEDKEKGIDVTKRAQQLLEEWAATAVQAGQKQVAAAQPQIAALEKLVEASAKGTKATREQEIQNQAALATQNAVALAEAEGTEAAIKRAKAVQTAAEATARYVDSLQQSIQANRLANEINKATEQVRFEGGLLGLDPIEAQRQLAYFQAAQFAAANFAESSGEARDRYLEAAKALADARYQVSLAAREQERWNDVIRSLADSIEEALIRPIESAFSGEKVESWGKRIKSMLGSVSSQIASSLFLRPAIGTALGALGFGGLASQYGSFGSLFGGSGGGSAPSPTSNMSNNPGLFSSTGSFLNSIGSSLGFATSSATGLVPYDALGMDVLGLTSGSSGLFGATTFSQYLGGAGAGFGAGTLLNSVLGGNQLGGTIGSGIGSLAGSAIGAIVGGPFGALIGGMLGGATGGGLGGLFGNSQPSANESASLFNIGTGATGPFASGGYDPQVKQYTDAISSFTKTIKDASGGSLAGTLNPVFSERDGFQLNYDIYGYGTGSYTASSVEDAVNTSKLVIARSLQGITDTMKTVIASISDPADLETGIKFAALYDNINDSIKDTFASVPGEQYTEGPFAKVKKQIEEFFDDTTKAAESYGLATDTLNAARDEARRRLAADFNRNIQSQITTIENPFQALVDAEHKAWIDRINDAVAAGGDLTEVYKLNWLEMEKIAKSQAAATKQLLSTIEGTLSGLPGDLYASGPFAQAKAALDALKDSAAEFGVSAEYLNEQLAIAGQRLTTDFNRSISDAILALEDPLESVIEIEKRLWASRINEALLAGGELKKVYELNMLEMTKIWEDQVAGIKALRAELKTGNFSGLSPAASVTAANDNFNRAVAAVRGGNLSRVGELEGLGRTAIEQSYQTYGNAPQTAALRESIIAAINSIIALRSFAGGTDSTPPGWIRVGERGPEWMYQPGGATVLPSGTAPSGNDNELLLELRALRVQVTMLLSAGNQITQAAAAETLKTLNAQIAAIKDKPLQEPIRRRLTA